MVFLLVAMLAMVFGNVVLRWTVNSGIDVSEELVALLLRWLHVHRAVVVMREHLHLGVDALVGRLARAAARLHVRLDALIPVLQCRVLWGTWQQAAINASNVSPVTGNLDDLGIRRPATSPA